MKKRVLLNLSLMLGLSLVLFGSISPGRSQAEPNGEPARVGMAADATVLIARQAEAQVNKKLHMYLPQILKMALARPALRVYEYAISDYMGNYDYVVNPGEFIYVKITLENTGSAPAYNVRLTATSSDPYLNPYASIYDYTTDGVYSYIGPGEVGNSLVRLWLGIASNTPEGHVITLDLLIEDSTGYTWIDAIQLSVTGSDTTPPFIADVRTDRLYVPVGEQVLLTDFVYETGTIASVTANIELPVGIPVADVPLYDDGTHGDVAAGDRIYSSYWTPTLLADFCVDITAVDGLGNSARRDGEACFTSQSYVHSADILLVMDDDTPYFSSYYTDALDANAYSYDVWATNFYGPIDSTTLSMYQDGVVIWATPTYGTLIDESMQATLMDYLDGGGKLFITGQDIGYYTYYYCITTFYNDYLHAAFLQDGTDLYTLRGVVGDPISAGMTLSITGGDGANNQVLPSEINPIAPAVPIFYYNPVAAEDSSRPSNPISLPPGAGKLLDRAPNSIEGIIGSGTGALRVDTGVYRVVYFAFGFEAIDNLAGTDRAAVMQSVLTWLLAP